jgi:hypothetical protein
MKRVAQCTILAMSLLLVAANARAGDKLLEEEASSQCRRQVADCRYYMHLEKAHVASRCAAGAGVVSLGWCIA